MGDEVRVTVIATGFETSRVQRKMEQPTFRPAARSNPQQQTQQQRPPMQQYSAPQQPQPVNAQPEQPPAQPPVQQPKPQQPDNFSARVYDEDNIEIPTFLRKQRR